MGKVIIKEEALREIIKERVEKALDEVLNEGLVNFLRGRTESPYVKINSCCDASYRYSSKTGTYWFYGNVIGIEPCDTGIGYNRKLLNADDKVTSKEKQNVINLLTRWDSTKGQELSDNARINQNMRQWRNKRDQQNAREKFERDQQWRQEDAAEAHGNYLMGLHNQSLGQHVDDGRHRNY